MFADRAFDLLSNQENRISIAETLETHFKVMCLLEEWAAWDCGCPVWQERVAKELFALWRALWSSRVSRYSSCPALHVWFPASCQWYSLCAETFADVAIHSCHLVQDCGFFVLYLIFTKSLSLMHGLSLSSPSYFYLFIVNYACQKRLGALGYYHSILYPKL